MNYIAIRAPGNLLLLTNAELVSLLSKDMAIWQKAIERGKHERRARTEQQRRPKELARKETLYDF